MSLRPSTRAPQSLSSNRRTLRNVADVLDLVNRFDAKRAADRIQNEYGPDVPSIPTLSEEVSHRGNSFEAEDFRSVADELEEQVESLRSSD